MNIAQWLFQIFATSILAVLFHELGHWLYFRLALKKRVEIRAMFGSSQNKIAVGYALDYANLTNADKFGVYSSGIVAGLLWINLTGYLINPWLTLLTIPYLVSGCRKDIKNIWRLKT